MAVAEWRSMFFDPRNPTYKKMYLGAREPVRGFESPLPVTQATTGELAAMDGVSSWA